MSALIIEVDNKDRRNKVRENKTLIKPRCEISLTHKPCTQKTLQPRYQLRHWCFLYLRICRDIFV